jgi:two-component system chemotaxis response regulator CheY
MMKTGASGNQFELQGKRLFGRKERQGESGMGKTVLIVDDSNIMHKILTRSLRQAGLDVTRVIEAGDGMEALQILENEPVDIVISDINMPNMNGVEFLREKQNQEALQQIPVVMITTESRSDILKEAIALGARGSITKPFTPDQVNATLSVFL